MQEAAAADSGSANRCFAQQEATNQHQDSLVVSKQTLVIMFPAKEPQVKLDVQWVPIRERGGTQCNPAEPGYYVDSHFASSQTACLAGTYNPSTGSTSSNDCMDAAPGFFVENVGSASQQAYQLGYYQPNSGWLSCLMADPGNYVDTLAATAQIACEAGTLIPTQDRQLRLLRCRTREHVRIALCFTDTL